MTHRPLSPVVFAGVCSLRRPIARALKGDVASPCFERQGRISVDSKGNIHTHCVERRVIRHLTTLGVLNVSHVMKEGRALEGTTIANTLSTSRQ